MPTSTTHSAVWSNYLKTIFEHCPEDRKNDAFYLTPLKKPRGNIWYTNTPAGHNTLDKTDKKLCSQAGVDGYKTNHFLRVTSATRLFQSGVDEQLIMSRTGHHSIEGVRAYKQVCTEQKENLSDILNSATNGSVIPYREKKIQAPSVPTETSSNHALNLSASSSSSSFCPPINISGCSSFTVNFNVS